MVCFSHSFTRRSVFTYQHLVWAFLLTIYGAGAIVGSTLALPLGKVRIGRLLLTWQWLAPLIVLLFLLVPPHLVTFRVGAFPLVALSVLAGTSFVYAGGETVVGNIAASYRMALIPDALQGRVNGVYRLVAFAGPPTGLALTGLLLQIGGLTLVIVVFVLALVAVAILYTLSPQTRRAQNLHSDVDESVDAQRAKASEPLA